MERLIRADHLRRYVLEIARGAEAAPTVERIAASTELPHKPRPTINYVLGDSVDDQYQSQRQKRRLLRAATTWARVNTIHVSDNSRAIQPIDGPIFFPPVNQSRVITPHHDALLLTLCINDFDVHKVPVNPSSVADLLQLPAFRQMNISFDMLSSACRILLSGFNGATTITMGDIDLPVKAGAAVQQVLFLVVEDLGPYNAIVRRAWLHAMKAVPSTYHQMINYLTSAEQIDLLSSQLAARQCYQLLVQKREKNKSSYNPALDT